jgi:Ran GTPase-activating protein (RanGAP) involved in mRNA processing and transport
MGPKGEPPPPVDDESDAEPEVEAKPCFCGNRMYAEGEQCRIDIHLQYSELPALFEEYTEFIEVENAIKRAKKIKKELPNLPQWQNNAAAAKDMRMINKALDDELYTALFASLKRNTYVNTIYLVNNGLGDDGVLYFAQCINRKLPLCHLRVCSNGMTPVSAVSLLRAISGVKALHILDLADNKLADEGMEILAQMLGRTPAVCQLGLRANSIGNKGMFALISTLQTHPKLHTIDLRENRLGPSAGASLAKALARNTTVVTLLLANNQLSDAGSEALAPVLISNTNLEKIDMRHNDIHGEGANSWIQALKKNTTLGELQLTNNPQVEVEHLQRVKLLLSVEQKLSRAAELQRIAQQQKQKEMLK